MSLQLFWQISSLHTYCAAATLPSFRTWTRIWRTTSTTIITARWTHSCSNRIVKSVNLLKKICWICHLIFIQCNPIYRLEVTFRTHSLILQLDHTHNLFISYILTITLTSNVFVTTAALSFTHVHCVIWLMAVLSGMCPANNVCTT